MELSGHNPIAGWGALVLKSKYWFYVLQICTILISTQDYHVLNWKKKSVFLKMVQGFGKHLSNLCLWRDQSILKQKKKHIKTEVKEKKIQK